MFIQFFTILYLIFGVAFGNDFVPGELIVKLKGDSESKESFQFMGKVHSKMGLSLKASWAASNMHHFKAGSSQTTAELIATLSADPAVEYVEPNYIFRKTQDPSGTHEVYSSEDLAEMADDGDTSVTGSSIGLEDTWSMMAVSQSTSTPIVAVIDTGLDIGHDVFVDSGAIHVNTNEIASNGLDDDGNGYVDDINGWNFVAGDGVMLDDDGHGTHVAGIILSVGQDIQKDPIDSAAIKIMPLKFLDSSGAGSTSAAIQAMYYACDNGATVINNSWGGPSYSASLLEVFVYCYERGVSIISAAGNASSDNDSTPMYPASFDVPSNIAIAALTDSDDLASFSNFGFSSVNLGSPGVFILSTYPGDSFATMSGTSMAAPFVAGVAALMKAASPTMNGYQIREIIYSEADFVNSLSSKVSTESKLDSANAIASAQSASVDSSLPAYSGSSTGSSELASSAAQAGGCGLVGSLLSKGGGTGSGGLLQRGLSLSEILFALALLMPMAVYLVMRKRPESRRQHKRFKIDTDVKINVGGKEMVGSLSTISMGGCAMKTSALLEEGGVVTMKIASPDGGDEVQVQGHVVWREASKGYGIQFDEAPQSVLQRISLWTRSLKLSA